MFLLHACWWKWLCVPIDSIEMKSVVQVPFHLLICVTNIQLSHNSLQIKVRAIQFKANTSSRRHQWKFCVTAFKVSDFFCYNFVKISFGTKCRDVTLTREICVIFVGFSEAFFEIRRGNVFGVFRSSFRSRSRANCIDYSAICDCLHL